MRIPLLPAEQFEAFQIQGYVKAPQLITPQQVAELRRDYDKALSGEIKVPAWGDDHIQGRVVQLAKPSEHIPGWRQHAYFLRALAIARQLIGAEGDYAYDQIIYKPPHHPAATEWHQDAGYWKNSRGSDNAVTCWLALSPAWKENGGMRFIPGSHRAEIQDHYNVSHRSEINQALATTVDTSLAVALTL